MCCKVFLNFFFFLSLPLLPNQPMPEQLACLCGSLIISAERVCCLQHTKCINHISYMWLYKKNQCKLCVVFNFCSLASVLRLGFFPGVHHCPILHAGCKTSPAATVALRNNNDKKELLHSLFNRPDQSGLAFLLTFLKMWFSCAAQGLLHGCNLHAFMLFESLFFFSVSVAIKKSLVEPLLGLMLVSKSPVLTKASSAQVCHS